MDKTEQIKEITDIYLVAFLSFALKRINNFNEAEELAQEIAYQCLLSINRCSTINNFEAFVWSIAHNTFKKWCIRKQMVSIDSESDTFTNIVSVDLPVEDSLINEENFNLVRRELSRLSNLYRQTLVCFYYEELSIREISKKLNISEEMVKFYLVKGRQKLREAYTMNNNIGEKSFNPSNFTVYKSAIDLSEINVWEVFKRLLPCQIALICHDSPKTVSEISIETGIPAVYIEDEIELLLDSGVMITPVKNKYRTNLFILKKNAVNQIKEQFNKLYSVYAPAVIMAFDKFLPELKQCNVFNYDAPDYRYAWFFLDGIMDFDYSGYEFTADDYPQILSCGSKAFIFAEESRGSVWRAGQTPTHLEKCIVWPRDIEVFGKYHCQEELRDSVKAQALYDVYCHNITDTDIGICAQLIAEGYVIKKNGVLICNVAVSTAKSRKLFKTINAEILTVLAPLCKEIRKNIYRIVKTTIPEQLLQYEKGYTETWISFYSGVYLHEALYNNGFITIPEKNDRTPVACYIYEK